jgi:hypothetical protein
VAVRSTPRVLLAAAKRKPWLLPLAQFEQRLLTVIKFWMDETSGVTLPLKIGIPSYQVENEEGGTHLLIHLPIEEEDEDRWCLWRSNQAGFNSRSIFQSALIEEWTGSRKTL